MKIKTSALLVLIMTSAILAELGWQPAGEVDRISISKTGVIRLSTEEPIVTGALSKLLDIPSGSNAILVEADVTNTDMRGLTLAVHDGASGEALGYWQNSLPIKTQTQISAVLSVSPKTSQIRIFVGTDNQPSKAEIKNIRWKPLRLGMNHKNSIYGALIDSKWSKRQTFKATGKELGAVVFRIRQRKGYRDGPNLAVRLYKWDDNMATSISKGPLAETIIPREQIPGTLEGVTEELDLAATYISGSRKLSVPLSASTVPGETYIIELAVDGPCQADQGFLSWCWEDGYPDGELFDNNSTRGRNWDLQLEVYDAVK